MKLDQKDIHDLVEFSQSHPWKPHYPKNLVHRFLTELISSDNLIFDLHDKNGRAAVAVLLDKIKNPGNNACLEIIGMRADVNQSEIFARFIEMAQDDLPEDKSGIQVSVLDSLVDENFLDSLELEHYYDTYEMKVYLDASSGQLQAEVSEALKTDSQEIHNVLSIAFKDSPDTSIPDLEAWNGNFLKSNKSHFYLWKDSDRIVGFLNLIISEDGSESEIRTIGVLPEFRGKRIGQKLLNHSLAQAFQLECQSCELTVAVTNKKALTLYQQAGFNPVATYKCYSMNSGL